MDSLRNTLIQAAREQGFEQIGFTPVGVLEKEKEDLAAWLREGRNGAMQWMEREPEKRTDPRLLFAETKTVMVVGANYFSRELPEAQINRIARYARGRDYHNMLPKRLKKVVRKAQELFPGLQAKICVDTSPIMEKPWAQRAGLGWQGKHTHLVSRSHGSWLILGIALLNQDVEPDLPHPDLCGSCNACVEACPTGALTEHKMDATKCISYWSIEHRGAFPANAPGLHGWAHGCDLCIQACPWNKFSVATQWADFKPRWSGLPMELLEDKEALAPLLPGTPLARPGVAGLRRNAGIKDQEPVGEP
jgi:epoxyqueuosine reductase